MRLMRNGLRNRLPNHVWSFVTVGAVLLLLLARCRVCWNDGLQPQSDASAPSRDQEFSGLHWLESTDRARRSCPAWNRTLPGAWREPKVQSDQGEVLFGTASALQQIYQRQHPVDCSKHRFLVHKSQASIALAAALDLDRIMLFLDPDDHPYLTDDFCNQQRSMDTCYFLPISNCYGSVTVPPLEQLRTLNYSDPTQNSEKFILEDSGYVARRYAVPTTFRQTLDLSTIPSSRQYYWWRSQAAAYMVRINERTSTALHELRRTYFPNADLLSNSIAIHIRRGDKWKEAPITNNTAYNTAAQKIFDNNAVSCKSIDGPPTCLKRSVFISTEDASAIDYFYNQTDWGVRYADNPALLKPDTKLWAHEYALKVGPSNDMLGSLLNLQLALECGAWVGTLSSNWCRLIDQMRSTVACKAHLPFVDPTELHQYEYNLGC